jgi:hypothetical protein
MGKKLISIWGATIGSGHWWEKITPLAIVMPAITSIKPVYWQLGR